KDIVVNREVLLTTTAGEKKYCLFSASEEETIEAEYFQCIAHDITELKKAEKANIRMEKRGMADRLVHILAHEVRNPLNNINLSLEQLSPEIQESDNKIFVDIIQRNSKRIESLITELLNSSRPAQIIEEPELLQNIIHDTLSMAIDRITLKKIQLHVDLPKEDITVLADKEKLKIALLNLIINAIEAMEAGQGELIVNLSVDKDLPVISIKDNGCGISDENISKLFEPYFTAKRNGMGLGLATSLNILQSHKADIEVLSTEFVGTEFLIKFNQKVSDSLLNKEAVSG
ncbi:MAG: hybrid sensor histidine kinase/response regulator, partial [Sphingobacteriales bacterium]